MFKILQKTLRAGTVTQPYPDSAAKLAEGFRGLPEFDWPTWRDARPAADACPTGAIAVSDAGSLRTVSVDYGRCILCGECVTATPEGAVRMGRNFEAAVTDRKALVFSAGYTTDEEGRQTHLVRASSTETGREIGRQLTSEIHRILGRSLAIREVDAGSCNGCELEIVALNNPVHDIERFGIHFVASPRHADMLLVTGPVTRNMELALRKTYDATPDPKLVVAVGACGISGGIFGTNYATRGGVDQVIPVDVYIPGCPPRPEALLFGILMAVGRLKHRR
jgi:Ni,Fe-hydrogenase III small subunit/formate hydrogenlyase subunit 6/NADH:ubiquinone oxidoreductase subunit I